MARAVTITGISEAGKRIRELRGRFDPSEFRPILLSGAQRMQEPVRTEASFSSLTGRMSRSIVAKLHANPNVATAYMAVDYKLLNKRDNKGKPSRYPFIVEYGSDPHTISGTPALKLKGGEFRGEVKHPGFRGRFFFKRGVGRGRTPAKREIERLLKLHVADLERNAGGL